MKTAHEVREARSEAILIPILTLSRLELIRRRNVRGATTIGTPIVCPIRARLMAEIPARIHIMEPDFRCLEIDVRHE